MEQMREYLKSFGILSAEDISQIENKATLKTIKKGDFFITEGSTSNQVGFVISGVFRSYYHSSSEEQVTYCFTFSNTFVSAYSSFLTQQPTSENIEALTDVEILNLSRDSIVALEQKNTNWLRFFKFMAEQEYIKMEQRIFLLQKETAEQRYKDLLKNHPNFLQLIPLSYLASYLGITQRHLSRIRKSISN